MSLPSTTLQTGTRIKAVLFEAVLVAMIGCAIAFAANALSPCGLKIAHNYFPAGTNTVLPEPKVVESSHDLANTNSLLAPKLISVPRLIDSGLQGIDYGQAVKFFHDPRRQQGLIVFIDARNDAHYQAGHIPGAYLLDPYHSDQYLATVLPVCQNAEQVVVYCVASECEDSQLAAVQLRNAGIPNQKLFVYVGGYTEWTANRQPIERGVRNSGDLYTPRE